MSYWSERRIKRIVKIYLIVSLIVTAYICASVIYNELRVPRIGYCMGATDEQEKFFEYTLGNALRHIGIKINADAVHTGYVGRGEQEFKEEASHVFLLLHINLWEKEFKFFWEATNLMPRTDNYLNRWDYYHITSGDYYDGVYIGTDPYYNHNTLFY